MVPQTKTQRESRGDGDAEEHDAQTVNRGRSPGGFVTALYEAYVAIGEADHRACRAFQLADLDNRRKLVAALPGITSDGHSWDTGFLKTPLQEALEEQFPALRHLDDEVDDPHQFTF